VSVASVKNFQLCDRNDQDNIMLQFGRIQGRHSFTMDFQHPLTAVQAFSIAISSLQSKISFG
jgi:tubby and related proteins